MNKPEFISCIHSERTKRFGKKLNDRLEQDGWTIQDIADFLAEDIRNVERWIHGYALPTVYQIEDICEILQCTQEELEYI